MRPSYVKPLALLANIRAACDDIERNLQQAAAIQPAQAKDPDGQDDEDIAAVKQRAAAEEAASGHFKDIADHVHAALGVPWVEEPPAAPIPPSAEPQPLATPPAAEAPAAPETPPVVPSEPPPAA